MISYNLYYIKDLIKEYDSVVVSEEDVEIIDSFANILTRHRDKIKAELLDRELARLSRAMREAVTPDEIRKIAYEIAKLEV